MSDMSKELSTCKLLHGRGLEFDIAVRFLCLCRNQYLKSLWMAFMRINRFKGKHAVSIGMLLTLSLPTLALYQSGRLQPKMPRIEFNRDIRPILSDNCLRCHGSDRANRKADLRLDQRDVAIQKQAIVPGNVSKSNMIMRITSTNPAVIMPPPASHKQLTSSQKQLLTRWIKEGAVYQDHWAYLPVSKPVLPRLTSGQSTSKNPIDGFILAKLNEKGIKPSPRADKRTLIRRIYLDLIGIPPTPAEVEAFLVDNSPSAYQKVVDRLLASPGYGERMAVPWLDVVRYADTVGFHGDQNMNAWAYRDYVIDSFNKNKPFDQFTIEQLAGDLLPNPTPEQLTATCFNRLNMMTREGGAQPKEYFAKYQADRVRTVAMTWLGSTLGCAECHNHKYDPFTTRDFYSMEAFFSDLKQWGVYEDYGYTPEPELRGINNDSPFPPEIKVTSPYLVARIARLNGAMLQLAKETAKAHASDSSFAFEAWRSKASAWLKQNPSGWETFSTPTISLTDPTAKTPKSSKNNLVANDVSASPYLEGSVALFGKSPVDLHLRFKPKTSDIAAIRLELLPGSKSAEGILRNGAMSTTVMMSAEVIGADKKPKPIAFRYAAANHYIPRFANGFEILGLQRGWPINVTGVTDICTSTWLPTVPISLNPGDELVVTLPGTIANRVRVSVSPFMPDKLAESQFTNVASITTDDGATSLAHLWATKYDTVSYQKLVAIQQDILECRNGVTPVMVVEHITPKTTRILARGNWQDESGEIVSPAIPAFLNKSNASTGRLTRLDLAKWIVSRDNPLTARTVVNRLWRQFFGNALSAQVDDLGTQGEWPSHPELLDWLASEFKTNWDIKRMVRLIVTSDAYCRTSSLRPELHNLDPNNRLLASQNPRRLEAEFIRDNALSISGQLCRDMGGPPVKPYQPAGYYANLQFPDRPYTPDKDEREWRRGVYIHWQRTFVLPMLLNFDGPSREDCIASRNVANTPQQALTLLNDPIFVEASRVFASNLLIQQGGTDELKITRAYQIAVARKPQSSELKSLLNFLKQTRETYKQNPDDAKKLLSIGYAERATGTDLNELAAWTNVCRILLNLQETITRY